MEGVGDVEDGELMAGGCGGTFGEVCKRNGAISRVTNTLHFNSHILHHKITRYQYYQCYKSFEVVRYHPSFKSISLSVSKQRG